MSDILAIVDQNNTDDQLVEEIAKRHPDKVTVLLQDGMADSSLDDSPRGLARRDRLAQLLAKIEQRTGAAVIGLAGSREQLRGWRFDRIVGSGGPVPAL